MSEAETRQSFLSFLSWRRGKKEGKVQIDYKDFETWFSLIERKKTEADRQGLPHRYLDGSGYESYYTIDTTEDVITVYEDHVFTGDKFQRDVVVVRKEKPLFFLTTDTIDASASPLLHIFNNELQSNTWRLRYQDLEKAKVFDSRKGYTWKGRMINRQAVLNAFTTEE